MRRVLLTLIIFLSIYNCYASGDGENDENKTKEVDGFLNTLGPSNMSFTFSTGANLDFLDGVKASSMYIDLLGNLGKFTSNSKFSLQVGMNSGRSSAREDTLSQKFAIRYREDSASYFFTENNYSRVVETQSDFSGIFARLNYHLTGSDAYIEVTAIGQLEYIRRKFKNTYFHLLQSVDTVGISRLPRIDSELPAQSIETIIRDEFYYGLGLQLYKNSSSDIEFQLLALAGLKSTSFGEIDPYYLFQANVFEKKAIGAKIGFELRGEYGKILERERPLFFFYVAKQFSVVKVFEAFKL